jgi:O-antigen/teichoic acid export membrane protein
MTATDRISSGFRATLVARVVHIASNAVLMILLTRFLLQPSEYGLLFLALSVVGVARLFSDLGLAKSAARYLTEYKESDPGQIPHILRFALRYRLLFIGVVGSALALLNEPLAAALGEPGLAPLLLVGAAYLCFHSLSVFNSLLFQGFNRVTWSALIQIVNNVNRIVFAVLFVFVLGLGALGALVGYVVGAAIGMVVGFVILYRQFYNTETAADDPDDGLSGRILRYSAPLTLTRGASVINGKIDTILIGVFLTPAAVGFYTLAKQITSSLLVPAGSLGFTISPAYGEQKANERLRRASRMYRTTLQYTLLLYLPAAVGLVLVAEPTVRIVFGEAYLDAVPVIQVLAVYVVVRAINEITTQALDFLGRARIRAAAKGTTAVANLGLNVLLIPTYGVVGAAAATVLTFTIYTLVNVYVMHTEVTVAVGPLLRPVALILAISAGMGGAVFALAPHISNVVSLLGVVLLGVAVWGSLATVSGLLDVRHTTSFLLNG